MAPMTGPQGAQQPTAGRGAEFAAGVAGGGAITSSLPPIKQAAAAFNPAASVLFASNQFSGVGLGSPDSTTAISNPYGMSMRNTLRQQDDGKVK